MKMSFLWVFGVVGLASEAMATGGQPFSSSEILPPSRAEILKEEGFDSPEKGALEIEIVDAEQQEKGNLVYLPARMILTGAAGTKIDGAGRGVYADGRFYVDGTCHVVAAPQKLAVHIHCGPNYIPLQLKLPIQAGKKIFLRALMKRWFSPQEKGWFCGDNHLHTRHDPSGGIRMDEPYTAMQARAEGLDYITEADGLWGWEEKLSTPQFLYRAAAEIRPAVFTGHANTPGILKPIPREKLQLLQKTILPMQSLCDLVHSMGGVVIYTHTSPVPCLHWMGATESLSDAVLGKCADAFDVANRAEELVWFTLLNLGNKVAVSGSTDAALVRPHTTRPGARRVYSKADRLQYQAIIEAIRKGKTFATNAGPLFCFFSVDGHEVGDEILITLPKRYKATLEIHHLYPLKRVEIIKNGNVVAECQEGKSVKESPFAHRWVLDIEEQASAWYAARVEDEKGNWALTSPIYFSKQNDTPPHATLVALEIGNFTRRVELRPHFFAHILVTTSAGKLRKVTLLHNGAVAKPFLPEKGNYTPSGTIPVTELSGEYSEGWVWHPQPTAAYHFQADSPIMEGGWYSVQVETSEGGPVRSEEIYLDLQNPHSQQISLLQLESNKTQLRLRGYGEEMVRSEIKIPFEGDHWWYPRNHFWELEAIFQNVHPCYQGGYQPARQKFKAAKNEN